MAARSLDERVEILEQKVGELQLLPARMDAVESQILQLRSDIRVEFSAIHTRLTAHDEKFKTTDKRFDETNQLMRALHEEVLTRLDDTNRRMLTLHQEVLTKLGDTNGQMRVLHEDVVSRIALLKEGR